MAWPAYQSHQLALGTTSLAITKPVSLAVGDKMVAWIAVYKNAGSASIATPSGWTQIAQDASSQGAAASFKKIADAGDVAASTFAFTSATADAMSGAIIRITTDDVVNSFDGSSHAVGMSATGFTPTIGYGLFLILTAYEGGNSNTVSAYAIGTSNPTWTEAFDTTSNPSGAFLGISMAYANRAALTATGAATATNSGATNATFLQVINVVSLLPSPFVLTGTLPRVPLVALPSPLQLASTTNLAGVSDSSPLWRTATKHQATFANQAKS